MPVTPSPLPPSVPHPSPLTDLVLAANGVKDQSPTSGFSRKAPIYNPYDKFTQPQFDAWIGDITTALRRALGHHDLDHKPTSHPRADEDVQTTTVRSEVEEHDARARGVHLRHIHNEGHLTRNIGVDTLVNAKTNIRTDSEDEDDIVEDSFADLRTRRERALAKGKARDPREGPGLGHATRRAHSPIVTEMLDSDSDAGIESASESDADADADVDVEEDVESDQSLEVEEGEDEEDEDYERGRWRGDQHVHDYVYDPAHGEGEEVVYEDEYFDEGAELEEDGVDLDEEHDDAEDGEDYSGREFARRQRPTYNFSGLRTEEEGEEEEEDILQFSSREASPEVVELASGDEGEKDGEDEEGRLNLNNDDLGEDDGEAPLTPELQDPWLGPQMFAEDFYSGGPVQRGRRKLSPSHLTPSEDEDEDGEGHRPRDPDMDVEEDEDVDVDHDADEGMALDVDNPDAIGMVFTPGVLTPSEDDQGTDVEADVEAEDAPHTAHLSPPTILTPGTGIQRNLRTPPTAIARTPALPSTPEPQRTAPKERLLEHSTRDVRPGYSLGRSAEKLGKWEAEECEEAGVEEEGLPDSSPPPSSPLEERFTRVSRGRFTQDPHEERVKDSSQHVNDQVQVGEEEDTSTLPTPSRAHPRSHSQNSSHRMQQESAHQDWNWPPAFPTGKLATRAGHLETSPMRAGYDIEPATPTGVKTSAKARSAPRTQLYSSSPSQSPSSSPSPSSARAARRYSGGKGSNSAVHVREMEDGSFLIDDESDEENNRVVAQMEEINDAVQDDDREDGDDDEDEGENIDGPLPLGTSDLADPDDYEDEVAQGHGSMAGYMHRRSARGLARGRLRGRDIRVSNGRTLTEDLPDADYVKDEFDDPWLNDIQAFDTSAQALEPEESISEGQTVDTKQEVSAQDVCVLETESKSVDDHSNDTPCNDAIPLSIDPALAAFDSTDQVAAFRTFFDLLSEQEVQATNAEANVDDLAETNGVHVNMHMDSAWNLHGQTDAAINLGSHVDMDTANLYAFISAASEDARSSLTRGNTLIAESGLVPSEDAGLDPTPALPAAQVEILDIDSESESPAHDSLVDPDTISQHAANKTNLTANLPVSKVSPSVSPAEVSEPKTSPEPTTVDDLEGEADLDSRNVTPGIDVVSIAGVADDGQIVRGTYDVEEFLSQSSRENSPASHSIAVDRDMRFDEHEKIQAPDRPEGFSAKFPTEVPMPISADPDVPDPLDLPHSLHPDAELDDSAVTVAPSSILGSVPAVLLRAMSRQKSFPGPSARGTISGNGPSGSTSGLFTPREGESVSLSSPIDNGSRTDALRDAPEIEVTHQSADTDYDGENSGAAGDTDEKHIAGNTSSRREYDAAEKVGAQKLDPAFQSDVLIHKKELSPDHSPLNDKEAGTTPVLPGDEHLESQITSAATGDLEEGNPNATTAVDDSHAASLANQTEEVAPPNANPEDEPFKLMGSDSKVAPGAVKDDGSSDDDGRVTPVEFTDKHAQRESVGALNISSEELGQTIFTCDEEGQPLSVDAKAQPEYPQETGQSSVEISSSLDSPRRNAKRKRTSSVSVPLRTTRSMTGALSKIDPQPVSSPRALKKSKIDQFPTNQANSSRSTPVPDELRLLEGSITSTSSSSGASTAVRLLLAPSGSSSRASSVISSTPSVADSIKSAFSTIIPPLFHTHGGLRHHHSNPSRMSPPHSSAPDVTPSAPQDLPEESATPRSSQILRAAPPSNSPVTRSNCRFHKISLPKEEGGPRVCFVVPGCSLSNGTLMDEQEIEDHGPASHEDHKRLVGNIESLWFNPYLVGTLRQLVGVDLLRENEVFYLLQPGEQAILKEKRKSRASFKEPASVLSRSVPSSPYTSMHASSTSLLARPPVSMSASISSGSVSHGSASVLTNTDDEFSGAEGNTTGKASKRDANSSINENDLTQPSDNAQASENTLKVFSNAGQRRSRRINVDNAAFKPDAREEEDVSDDGELAAGKRRRSRGIKRRRDKAEGDLPLETQNKKRKEGSGITKAETL